jgi:hypothetical protein
MFEVIWVNHDYVFNVSHVKYMACAKLIVFGVIYEIKLERRMWRQRPSIRSPIRD